MKLGLGSVQFGLDYGISNQSGRVQLNEAASIVDLAFKKGLEIIDTAQGYGNSEHTLGKIGVSKFKVITKLSANDDFHKSLENLKLTSVYGLLAHNVEEIITSRELWDRFCDYKGQGLVDKIGVSVYNENQIDAILERYDIDIIQLPINIYDQRLLKSGHLKTLKNSGVEIHARSVFLQGLIFLEPDSMPCYFLQHKKTIQKFRSFINNNNVSPIEAALGFVNSIDEIDNIIVGVDNEIQLYNIINTFEVLKNIDYSSFIGSYNEKLVNPVNWRIND